MAFIEPLYQNPSLLVTVLISAAINIVFIAISFIEPYKSVWQHAMKTWTHQDGQKLNALIFTKSGALRQEYGDIGQDGTFEYRDSKYAVVKQAMFNYKGIPTQLYKENEMEPFDPFDRQDVAKLSTDEAQRVMMSNENLIDILQKVKKYAPYVAIGIIVLIGVLGALAYLNYQVFDAVVQSAGTAATELQNTA